MRKIPLLLASITLAGCSTLSFQEPTEGPRARVRFGTSTSNNTALNRYDGPGCASKEQQMMVLRNGPLLFPTSRRLGIELWNHHDNAAKEVYVRANEPLHAMFAGGELTGNTYFGCAVPFSYVFEEGRDYDVAFTYRYPKCFVAISEIKREEAGWVKSFLRGFDNSMSDEKLGCEKVFRK